MLAYIADGLGRGICSLYAVENEPLQEQLHKKGKAGQEMSESFDYCCSLSTQTAPANEPGASPEAAQSIIIYTVHTPGHRS